MENSKIEKVPAEFTKRIVAGMEIEKRKVTRLEASIKEDVHWGLYSKQSLTI